MKVARLSLSRPTNTPCWMEPSPTILQCGSYREDIKNFIGEDFRDIGMPTKESTTVDENEKNPKKIEEANKRIRKEMKKAKVNMERVSKEYLKRLVMNATAPYEA
jgi:hypothetical protein